MALSPYTFRGALSVLDIDARNRSAFERFFGTAIFVGAGAATLAGGPVAGLTAAAWLSLVDPKNEAVSLLDALVTNVTKRLRGTKDKNQLDLVVAAHTITAVSSFFDALPQIIGPKYRELGLTDQERRHLLAVPGTGSDDLFDVVVPLSSPELGLEENIDRNLKPYYQRLGRRCLDFFTGLEAWSRLEPVPSAGLKEAIVERAASLYRSRLLELSNSAPFSLWVTLNEFSGTRELIRAQAGVQEAALGELRTMLAMVMPGRPAARNSYREKLALAAREVLDEPLLRSRTQSVASPPVRDGFVEPTFHYAVADDRSRPSDEAWWSEQPEHSSLVEYLASYLASPEGARRPLLLLGHPGAGKSLLTEVLAAQLPEDAFAVVRVPLRSVNPDDDLTLQINKELQRTLQRPNADLDELRQECGACEFCGDASVCPHRCHLVVLLDGFDELVQATGVTQSAYLSKVEDFQKRARTLGTPTSVIVTSRTVVADRAEIAADTPMIKLREFDRPRIEQWLTAWNAAHAGAATFVPLEIEEMTVSDEIAELSSQPLLLLMLAVYLAELGTNQLGGADLTQSELYQRIMDRFITRQITEKTAPEASEPEQKLLQRQQRRQLQYAAIGMFNRGRQHITDIELNADLAALEPPAVAPPGIQPLTAADRVLGDFMFVHNPRADREQRSAYEFLHATFGEFLVAELVVELLVQLMRHRDLETASLSPQPTALDDTLLRRLLSHQPLSTRGPVRLFIAELAERLPEEQHPSLRATISELLRRELTRPDTGDQLYVPLPYDPVRHRASYTANLTMLRILLDAEPVPVHDLVGSDAADRWRPLVHLWRAGLDNAAWFSVMSTLGVEASEEPPPWWNLRLCLRLDSTHDVLVNEAELLGDQTHKARLVVGALATQVVDDPWDPWREADLAAIQQVAVIHFAASGTPHFGRPLPYDHAWYQNLLTILSGRTDVNSNVKRAISILLSRAAGDLPVEEVTELLTHAFPPPENTGYQVEFAATAVCHPSVLNAIPGLEDHIRAVPSPIAPTVVAMLWYAEQRASGAVQEQLREMRLDIDRELAQTPASCAHTYFAPEFVTYLRLEQPPHWTPRQPVLRIFDNLEGSILASIAPEDMLFLVETWPEDVDDFIGLYLEGRAVPLKQGDDPLEVLRALVRT
ncbi:hypothetical protein EV651_118169 [Kribbella sp. VKM Ac-2571]|uniref:NACHT domain-containing protein n=1 Tax=Kribbella sp. VKM Ac-2571 TaxID=2512222 RepID=UPI00105C6F71|nr:hypothetical protein [Kribbella sp. VKM Ac-2571]TDO52147.1 hypothetical protein EV651_118169 [Kribbella sp. VKM Ac-2571]